MQPILKEMLSRRRDRAIAIILQTKERDCDNFLPREAQFKLRKTVLDQFNEFADFAVDICNSLDTGEFVLNEEYLVKIDELHSGMTELLGKI